MKRQRGRNRKPGGNSNANNTNPNRSWDSQGPENIKVRGNAQTVYERYMQLARDASAAGDRVLAENYTQHAEHYFRVLRALQPQRPVSEIAQRELAGQGFDIDFEDESGAQAAAFVAAQQAEQQKIDDEARRQAERADRDQNRDREQREPREYREPREAREPREPRDQDDREPRAEGEGGRRETRRERWERRREERNRRFENGEVSAEGEEADPGPDPVDAPVEDAPAEQAPEKPARAPRRPRSQPLDDAGDADDGPSALPGFLTRSSVPSTPPVGDAEPDAAEVAAPRRRTRRKAETAPSED